MGSYGRSIEAPLLSVSSSHESYSKRSITWSWSKLFFLLLLALLTISVLSLGLIGSTKISFSWGLTTKDNHNGNNGTPQQQPHVSEVVQSEKGVVAADDARCSEVGASMLRKGGHAVDAAVATALCVGVVNPMASGIGGGAFMVVTSASTSEATAFDMRETAPAAASQNMYNNDPVAKYNGPLSMGIPGEVAGLYEAWRKYGRFPWKTLFQPSIDLAKNGFEVFPYLESEMVTNEYKILADPGLRKVFAPNGKLLQAGETCYNVELARTLESIAEEGPQALYNGSIGEKLVKDVQEAGGIITMEDMRDYRVKVTDALAVEVMGFKLLGMPPPSSGTLGISMILNILNSYGSTSALEGSLGLHRLIEAMKHMFAIRMNLGDPAFVDNSRYMSAMTSPSFAEMIRKKIYDNTTFPPEYYMPRWRQLDDHGTSHFCIVDEERNAVSLTTTVNYPFGAGVLSPSTGIVLNNEMDDFSAPTEVSSEELPPAPANFIQPGKRPLSSMTPLIVLKDNKLAGVIGGSGGMQIIPAVAQVFINHFILGMNALPAVQSPRVYHKLIPNVVSYENVTVIDGEHIELPKESIDFLEERGHQLKAVGIKAICQLVVQTFESPVDLGRKNGGGGSVGSANFGKLTAVSDPRKDGKPAAE